MLQRIGKHLFFSTRTEAAASSACRAGVHGTLPTLSRHRSRQRGSRGSKFLCLIKGILKSNYFSSIQKLKKKNHNDCVSCPSPSVYSAQNYTDTTNMHQLFFPQCKYLRTIMKMDVSFRPAHRPPRKGSRRLLEYI